jgi:hypothetical protein
MSENTQKETMLGNSYTKQKEVAMYGSQINIWWAGNRVSESKLGTENLLIRGIEFGVDRYKGGRLRG